MTERERRRSGVPVFFVLSISWVMRIAFADIPIARQALRHGSRETRFPEPFGPSGVLRHSCFAILRRAYSFFRRRALPRRCFRLFQLYFFWNFSTRPAASTYFIFPVKYGCE